MNGVTIWLDPQSVWTMREFLSLKYAEHGKK